jgi:hypothetical protein
MVTVGEIMVEVGGVFTFCERDYTVFVFVDTAESFFRLGVLLGLSAS